MEHDRTHGAPETAEAAAGMDDRPIPANQHPEDTMGTNYEFNRAQDAGQQAANTGYQAFQQGAQQATQGFQQATDTMRQHGEEAMKQGQAMWGQTADRSREAMDKGMKAFEEFNAQARGQVDAWTQASRAAAQGVEAIVQQAAEFSRRTFEDGTAALRTLASARTPTEVFQAQNDFTKKQFDNFVGQFSRLTETMMKVTNEVMEPVASKLSETASKAGETFKQGVSGFGQR